MAGTLMTKLAKWTALMLAALCLLALPAVIAPVAAFGQGAEEEYDLDLPTSGGDQSTPAANANNTTDDDGGDFPVLVVIIVGAAAVAVGLALWRLQVGRRMDELDDDPPADSP
jgi:hypothetical protein